MVRKYLFDAGLIINEPKCNMDPALCLRQLDFDFDMGEGKFRVPVDRWEALHSKTDVILSASGGRVHARKLSSLTGTMISMKLSWGPVTQLRTRHMYALINLVFFLNSWMPLTEKAKGELLFWQHLPRLRFDSDIWPTLKGVRVHPGGHGRERLRVGRAHNDRTHGDRERILLGVGGRVILHFPRALGSFPVPASHGSPV